MGLDRTYICRLGSLSAFTNFELHTLIVSQGLIIGLHIGSMYEQIVAAFIGKDEAKPLFLTEPLHSTCSHKLVSVS